LERMHRHNRPWYGRDLGRHALRRTPRTDPSIGCGMGWDNFEAHRDAEGLGKARTGPWDACGMDAKGEVRRGAVHAPG
jgi:hypothetical protein